MLKRVYKDYELQRLANGTYRYVKINAANPGPAILGDRKVKRTDSIKVEDEQGIGLKYVENANLVDESGRDEVDRAIVAHANANRFVRQRTDREPAYRLGQDPRIR